MERPRCCPEPRCTPLYQYPYRPNRLSPGDSFSCFGRMAQPVTFIYDGVEHANDLNHCDYTPLKGLIRWQESREDWEAIRLMVTEALTRLDAAGGG